MPRHLREMNTGGNPDKRACDQGEQQCRKRLRPNLPHGKQNFVGVPPRAVSDFVSPLVNSPSTPSLALRPRQVILTPGASGPSRSHLQIVSSSTYENYDQELYLKEADCALRVLPDYIMRQRDVTIPMRSVVVDWLSEVCQNFALCSDTLFLAATCFDRYLSKRATKPEDLQLVGVTCLWIAAKYEEIVCPKLQSFCEITNNGYTIKQMLAMERQILRTLNYQLTVPTSKTFLRLYVCDGMPNVHIYLMASYLLELALLDYSCLRFLPSQLAGAAVFWSSVVIGEPLPREMLAHIGCCNPADVMRCAKHLALLHLASFEGGSSSVKQKYSQKNCFKVALIAPRGLSALQLLS